MRLKIFTFPGGFFIEEEEGPLKVHSKAVPSEEDLRAYLLGKGAPPALIETVLSRLKDPRNEDHSTTVSI